MGYVFKGIITSATPIELSIVKFNHPYKDFSDPTSMIIADLDLPYDEIRELSRRISAKLLGRKVLCMDYSTFGGRLDCFNCSLWVNGMIIDKLDYLQEEVNGQDAFFKAMLEFGIVLDENGYFKPFDRSINGHVGV